jgi:hypothetical protein
MKNNKLLLLRRRDLLVEEKCKFLSNKSQNLRMEQKFQSKFHLRNIKLLLVLNMTIVVEIVNNKHLLSNHIAMFLHLDYHS